MIEEAHRYSENRSLRGYPIGKYALYPAGKRELEVYEEKKKQKEKSNNISEIALGVSIASLIVSIVLGVAK